MRKTGPATSPHVTPHAWVRMDASGLIRFVSRQAELLFGYDGDDLGGQPIEMLIPEPVCKIYQEHRQDSCPGPGPVPGDWIWCEADGGGTGTGSLRASTCPTSTPVMACR
jgi:PAS domain S-box-containing protein